MVRAKGGMMAPVTNGTRVRQVAIGKNRYRRGSVLAVGIFETVVQWYEHGPAWVPMSEFVIVETEKFWDRFGRVDDHDG